MKGGLAAGSAQGSGMARINNLTCYKLKNRLFSGHLVRHHIHPQCLSKLVNKTKLFPKTFTFYLPKYGDLSCDSIDYYNRNKTKTKYLKPNEDEPTLETISLSALYIQPQQHSGSISGADDTGKSSYCARVCWGMCNVFVLLNFPFIEKDRHRSFHP